MKKFFLLMIVLTAVLFSQAQPGELMVKNGSKGLYLEHKVVAKEGLYSVGRVYQVSPKFIAAYNGIDLNKGISIGQVLRIPLTDTNFSQQGNTGTPVYYLVGAGEGLMKVSNSSNKVPLKNIREWNRLTSDNVKAGTKLIVGYLTTTNAAAPAVVAGPPAVQPETVKPAEEPPVVKNDPPIVVRDAPAEEIKKDDAPVTPPVVIADNKQPQVAITPASGESGYFKAYFDQQIKTTPVSTNATVTSGIFKTTSGMQDAKYYLLIDGVPPGTIVRVINPDNNKAIYAKVLGEMSGIRQNQGLDIRISNAAASALQITDEEKFVVKVNY
ncbi:MAG: LysM peptidoglycan-binding domain-containing protein [Chitinophagaceae bacterium]